MKSALCEKSDPPAAARPGRPADPAKRQAIIDAAVALFFEQGYARTTMDEIAARADVAKQTVYRHFATKETLLRQAMIAKKEATTPDPMLLANQGMAPADALRHLARGFLDLLTSEEALKITRLMIEEAQSSPELVEIFYEEGPVRMQAMVTAYLASETARGRLTVPDPDLAAELLISLIKGQHHMACMIGLAAPRDHEAEMRRVDEALELFLARYGVSPPA